MADEGLCPSIIKRTQQSRGAACEGAWKIASTLKQYKNQLLLDITMEGLPIQIADGQNCPMFALSKAELWYYTKETLCGG